jgi:hypothetical protein
MAVVYCLFVGFSQDLLMPGLGATLTSGLSTSGSLSDSPSNPPLSHSPALPPHCLTHHLGIGHPGIGLSNVKFHQHSTGTWSICAPVHLQKGSTFCIQFPLCPICLCNAATMCFILGVHWFSMKEMAFNILGLMHFILFSITQVKPIRADLKIVTSWLTGEILLQ